MGLDFRTMQPKPFMEIFPAVIPLSSISHAVLHHTQSQPIPIPTLKNTAVYPVTRPSYETVNPINLSALGPTRKAPLGSVVHARSGDKADNSNVGFFVRNQDEYPWLQSLLTVEMIKELLGKDWERQKHHSRVERCEFSNILAVHL